MVGNNPERIIEIALNTLNNGNLRKRKPKYWDGKASNRIIKVLNNQL